MFWSFIQRNVAEYSGQAGGSTTASPTGQFMQRIDSLTRITLLFVILTASIFPGPIRHPLLQWLPWMIGLLIFGLPHGGLDDMVPSLLRGKGLVRSGSLSFYLWYIGLFGLVLAVWAVSPAIGLVSFLILSGYHFGQGDLTWHRIKDRAVKHPGMIDRLWELTFLLSRSLTPVVLPFAFHSTDFTAIVNEMTIGYRHGNGIDAIPLLVDRYRTYLLLTVSILIATEIVLGWFRSSPSAHERWTASFESLLLSLLLVVTPPIFGIGVYFLAWHSVRHVCRLALLAPDLRHLVERGRGLTALSRFHLHALPPVAGALVLLGSIILFFKIYQLPLSRMILPAFLFVNAITLPHLLVVSHLDRGFKRASSSRDRIFEVGNREGSHFAGEKR
jgi:Brp/Blh family beta-carotene 15,15'-monooxygenase